MIAIASLVLQLPAYEEFFDGFDDLSPP